MITWPEEFVHGAAMFNAGRYFETHEVWEEIWKKAPPAERDFYQGMIHLTVALYQAGRSNWYAANSQLRRAARRLARFEPKYGELDLAAFRTAVAGCVAALQNGSPVDRYPTLNLKRTRTCTEP
jgi:uncharacterized protein